MTTSPLPKWFFEDDFPIDIVVIPNSGTANDHNTVGDTSKQSENMINCNKYTSNLG